MKGELQSVVVKRALPVDTPAEGYNVIPSESFGGRTTRNLRRLTANDLSQCPYHNVIPSESFRRRTTRNLRRLTANDLPQCPYHNVIPSESFRGRTTRNLRRLTANDLSQCPYHTVIPSESFRGRTTRNLGRLIANNIGKKLDAQRLRPITEPVLSTAEGLRVTSGGAGASYA